MSGAERSEARVPATAGAVVDLLNSRPHATPAMADALDDPERAAELLRPFGQPADTPLTPERLDRVRALRADLMAVLDDPDDPEPGWTKVTGHAAEVSFRQTFAPGPQARLHQVSGDPVIGGITIAVAELVAAGTWSRIRACAYEQCQHVFYDTTRSRTQRWHSYEMCGNRANVAAYRARSGRTRATG
ncbi:CGNR zinc finger domain-containing protein [Plantactinospora sonchi]|uniref:CGNR zinc finger domain-containing protein n=1 Tax=Plantactinospora sonchi TaxID=1544735 RepID=A0ABU7RNT2_9ACTN